MTQTFARKEKIITPKSKNEHMYSTARADCQYKANFRAQNTDKCIQNLSETPNDKPKAIMFK